jgi:hypothetical protein
MNKERLTNGRGTTFFREQLTLKVERNSGPTFKPFKVFETKQNMSKKDELLRERLTLRQEYRAEYLRVHQKDCPIRYDNGWYYLRGEKYRPTALRKMLTTLQSRDAKGKYLGALRRAPKSVFKCTPGYEDWLAENLPMKVYESDEENIWGDKLVFAFNEGTGANELFHPETITIEP